MITAVAAGIFYRIVGLGIGAAFAVMGYWLLQVGIFDKTELNVIWKDRSLLIKRASPGTLFALFGAAVILMMIWKDLKVSDSEGNRFETSVHASVMPQGPQYATDPSYQPAILLMKPNSVPTALTKLVNGGDITPEEKSAALQWYVETERAYINPEVRPLLRTAVTNGSQLKEHERYALKAWMTDPSSFAEVNRP